MEEGRSLDGNDIIDFVLTSLKMTDFSLKEKNHENSFNDFNLKTKKKLISPRNINQKDFIGNLMNYDLTRILICTFFFMVLINGFNLIDGTNCLCSLNLFLILTFIFLLINTLNINYLNTELKILFIPLSIFLIFNFF